MRAPLGENYQYSTHRGFLKKAFTTLSFNSFLHVRYARLSKMGSSAMLVMCDFDETIVNIDTAEYALEHFGDPQWMRIEKQFEAGEITFEESLRDEFALIKAREHTILDALDKVVVLRPNFGKLVRSCKRNHVPLMVVSGGLEFSIRHFLDREDWLSHVKIYAPKARYTSKGYDLTFPKPLSVGSVNFKDDLVKHHKDQGDKVFYVGDGLGDFPAAKIADFRFAIKASKLAEECQKANIAHMEITDFQEVIDAIDELKG
jgi:2-hydroxy-3-keto-5-methylthiopentenyl-1-phosphate phosphatase